MHEHKTFAKHTATRDLFHEYHDVRRVPSVAIPANRNLDASSSLTRGQSKNVRVILGYIESVRFDFSIQCVCCHKGGFVSARRQECSELEAIVNFVCSIPICDAESTYSVQCRIICSGPIRISILKNVLLHNKLHWMTGKSKRAFAFCAKMQRISKLTERSASMSDCQDHGRSGRIRNTAKILSN